MFAKTRDDERATDEYVPPAVTVVGTLHELTLGCDGEHGVGTGSMIDPAHIFCASV